MAVTLEERKTEIKTTIREFIVNNFLFGNDDESFTVEDSFMEKGIIDSTGILEVIEFIEESYEIKIEDDELLPENLDSLINLSNFITRKMEA